MAIGAVTVAEADTNTTNGDTSAATRSPTVARRMLLTGLQALAAERPEITLAHIAESAGVTVSTAGRWMRGENLNLKRHQIVAICGAFGLAAEHERTQQLVRLAANAKRRGVTQDRRSWMEKNQFDEFVGLEQGASLVVDVESSIVPGLLQTEDYAEAVIRATEVGIDETAAAEGVALRLTRQKALHRPENPLRLVAILDEAVLYRGPTDKAVMRRQLQHLLNASRWPNVTIMVVPFNAGVHIGGETSPFVLMEFEGDVAPVAYSETPAKAYYVESQDGIARYRAVIERLTSLAQVDEGAVGMITKALQSLGAAQRRTNGTAER